jgi:hypothetical protein
MCFCVTMSYFLCRWVRRLVHLRESTGYCSSLLKWEHELKVMGLAENLKFPRPPVLTEENLSKMRDIL